tara:strand:- start:3859 stop:4578 length:720 start_codon:yes stop_codon:yes gene_type:complete
MLRRILIVALIAGGLSGAVMSGVQMIWSVPLIIAAEAFENAPADASPSLHTHADGHLHDHQSGAVWAPEGPYERTFWTVVTNVLFGVGAGLVMTAFLALRRNPTTVRTGLLFGAAAFASFSFAPALGLPPELPGMAAADLQGRQAWWFMTALGTAIALAVLVYAPQMWMRVLAVLIIALPHLIGAPQAASHETAVPYDLIREFIAASLITTAIFWLALGGLVGALAEKFNLGQTETAAA